LVPIALTLIVLLIVLSALTLPLIVLLLAALAALTALATLVGILTLTLPLATLVLLRLGIVVTHRSSPARLNAEVRTTCAPWRDGSVRVACIGPDAFQPFNQGCP